MKRYPMLRKMFRAICMLVLVTSWYAKANFVEDFQTAKTLFDQKKYGAAHHAFAQLAETAPRVRAVASSLYWAALACDRDGRQEEALALAKTISDRPMAVYTQMQILSDRREYSTLIDQFDQEKIEAWPDAINYKGCFLRGMAYSILGHREAAAADFMRCVDLSGSDTRMLLEALYHLAGQQKALADTAVARDTYRKMFAVFERAPRWKGRAIYPQAILGMVKILMDENKLKEAEGLLGKRAVQADPSKRGPWDFLILEAYGDLALARGDSSGALAKYQEAAAIETHQSYLDHVKSKIEALTHKE